MRLVERRRLVKKTRIAAENKTTKVVLGQLQSRYRSLKRELRKGNFRKRMRKFTKQDPLEGAIQPGGDNWQEWIDIFTETLTNSIMEGADMVGSIENEIWMSRGYPQYIVDPQMIIDRYQARTGKQIKNIATDTRDNTLQAISDWFNTDAGLPTLIEDLEEYFSEARSKLIASTEMGYVASEVADEQMGEYGISRWIWDAFDDWLVCKQCAELDGQVFNRGDPMPPDASHPACRCGVLFADENGLELVAKRGDLGKGGGWEDVEQDERGRWAGSGAEARNEAVKVASGRLAADAKSEPGITASLQGIATETGGKMAGLEFRMKREESMERKILVEAEEKGITLQEAEAQITDGIRYTMTFGAGSFGSNVQDVEGRLKAAGYERYDHKYINYFNSSGPYRGLNTVWRSTSTGTCFELQFHTEESLQIKDENHVIYEDYRLSTDEAERTAMYSQMVGNYAIYTVPVGTGALQ